MNLMGLADSLGNLPISKPIPKITRGTAEKAVSKDEDIWKVDGAVYTLFTTLC
jgi:hypothetical protein